MKSIDQAHASINARIWQGIAQSGIDTSTIPREKMETLVGAIADSILVGIDEMIGELEPERALSADDPPAEEEGEERILWEGRPFLSLTDRYQITTDRIRITSGLLAKERNDIELFRVHDINHTQHLGERMINIGDVTLTFDEDDEEDLVLRNISDPETVHELLRAAVLDARRRQRVRFTEPL